LRQMEPGARIPGQLAREGRRRGASRLEDGITAARALDVLRNHRWATYERQQALYWGAGRETPLTRAIRALTGAAEARDRRAVVTGLQHLGSEPPEWLVSRLCRQ
jgi:hypothetical protein